MRFFDVGIIGGSLSGSFTALMLARLGLKVALFEPTPMLGRKACGEGLSVIGQRYLLKAGLWDEILETSSRPYYGYSISMGDSKQLEIRSGTIKGYAVHRRIIDQKVFNSATSQQNVTLFDERVSSVTYQSGQWKISGKGSEVCARQAVMASGLPGRKLAGLEWAADSGATKRYAFALKVRGKWRGEIPRTVIIQNHANTQILLTPFSDGYINLSIMVCKDDLPADSRQHLTRQALNLANDYGFEYEDIEHCYGAAEIKSSAVKWQDNRIFPVGDTAEIFDPIGGMGMSHALLSAILAAEQIQKSARSPQQAEHYLKRYHSMRQRYSLILRILTAASHRLNVRQCTLTSSLLTALPYTSEKIMQALAICTQPPQWMIPHDLNAGENQSLLLSNIIRNENE